MSKPKTTVITAVYSKDPDRHMLLESHAECLRKQTVPVESVYVFDSYDTPPSTIYGEFIISSKPLTIYEAWNAAIAAVRTTFVMNLNLDDRLHSDAVEELERTLEVHGGDLIGGDWRIGYSQEEVNATDLCYPAGNLPRNAWWPPQKGSVVRLGSGIGGTYGPAVMWRMALHAEFPRYPYRTEDGYRIRGVADAIWWSKLAKAGKKMMMSPNIIGNYHSHPETQAEFKYLGEWETLKDKVVSDI